MIDDDDDDDDYNIITIMTIIICIFLCNWSHTHIHPNDLLNVEDKEEKYKALQLFEILAILLASLFGKDKFIVQVAEFVVSQENLGLKAVHRYNYTGSGTYGRNVGLGFRLN